jgi:hypothetical protein
VAFSRILVDREVLVVANTNSSGGFSGSVIVDRDINATPKRMQVAFSNLGTNGAGMVQQIGAARIYAANAVTTVAVAALPVVLASSEVQILTPV